MIQLPQDFKEFFQLLNSNKVEYLLIGGYAVGYYGYPRATADIDIWISTKPINAKKMVNVLNEFGFQDEHLSSSIFLRPDQVIRMGIPPLRIKVITSISGVDFQPCYSNRVVELIDGVELSIISLLNLKENKKASGRNKDLADLENLP